MMSASGSLRGEMRFHRTVFSIISALLFAVVLDGRAAEAKKPPLKWITLPDCQLLPAEHRDGDSFHMMTADQRQFIFRLYFTDAPETDSSVKERVAEQAAYFGVNEAEIIKGGAAAKKFAAECLTRGGTITTRWQNAQGRSRLPRYYAQIDVGGRDLGELLVSHGWARAKGAVAILPDGKPAKEQVAKLQQLEAEAKSKRLGLWAKAGK
jgi:endonuclease YncB( thermonuclease family)